MHTLDDIIMNIARPAANPIRFEEGAAFYIGMKKMADELNAPDTSGQVEGPFAVPLDQAVQLMATMVSNEFKTQVYYIFYAHMLRGLSHHAISEEFMAHAEDELEHAKYLLRRIGVLSPGGVEIPSYPPPAPMSDPAEIVQTMLVVEQMGLSLWKQLLAIMGENPMRHTIEDFLRREEEHQDELWQLIEQASPAAMVPEQEQAQAPAPEAAPAEAGAPKVAALLAAVKMRKLAAEHDRTLADLALAVKSNNKTEIARLKGMLGAAEKKAALALVRAKKANFAVPPPGQDTPDAYLAREKELAAQQAMSEAVHARTVAMQASQAAQQARSEAQAAQQQAQELQATLEQQQAAQQQASTQAIQAQQQAAEAEARAAEHSISKMQLGMRINQMRQELANLVMQDPVSENAATVSDMAAQGQPATPQQQADAEAQQQAEAAAQQQPPSAETQQQAAEAEGAQQNAEEQQAEAAQAAQKDQAKAASLQTSVATVIPRSRAGKTVQQVMHQAPAAAEAAGGMLSKLRGVATHPVTAALGGIGLVGGGALLANHAQKTASPADRRLREMIMQGGDDALGNALRSVVRAPKAVPVAQQVASASSSDVADALVNHGVEQAKQQISTLGARIRPHLPGFAAGVGTALVGRKLLGSSPDQPAAGMGQNQEWG
jgi:bacterioferritin (cytochrome b1)